MLVQLLGASQGDSFRHLKLTKYLWKETDSSLAIFLQVKMPKTPNFFLNFS